MLGRSGGKFHNRGTYVYCNGDKFVGLWRQGEKVISAHIFASHFLVSCRFEMHILGNFNAK